MYAYIIRRVLAVVPVMFVVAIVVFLLLHLTPGDPAAIIAGDYAKPEDIARIRARLGLDQPLLVQFGTWLGHILTGDLGESIFSNLPVAHLIGQRLEPTIVLAVATIIVSCLTAVPMGVIAAWRAGALIDRAIMIVSVFAVSMPAYWLGLLFIFVFSVQLGWLPTGGMYSFIDGKTLGSILEHMIMPGIVAGLTPAAIIARVARSAMLEVMRLDYMTALRAKGLTESSVILGHALRNAMPTIVSMTGLQVGYLILGAALFVEIIFSWPGLGLEIYKSVVGRDMPMMLGLVLFSTFVFVLLNLIVDVIYRLINPRVRDA